MGQKLTECDSLNDIASGQEQPRIPPSVDRWQTRFGTRGSGPGIAVVLLVLPGIVERMVEFESNGMLSHGKMQNLR